jgi:hypothetical protein
MKGNAWFLAVYFLIVICYSTKADEPVFGNSPDGGTGFSISNYGQLSLMGGAVEFTPFENIYVDSITLWLSDYTGQHGQAIYVGIYYNSDDSALNPGTASNFPGQQILSFSSAAPNDGSTYSFTFSNPTGTPINNPTDSTLLAAGTSYWLVVTSEGRPDGFTSEANWVGGGITTGEAAYDGSDDYKVSGESYDSSCVLPAFTINAVPEPGFAALMSIPLLLGITRTLYRNRKSSH